MTRAGALTGAMLLAGCVNGQPNAVNTVAGLQSAYATAVAAEITYESSGKTEIDVVRQIEFYRERAAIDLAPLVTAAETGASIDAAALTVVTDELTQFSAYMAAKGLMKGAP